MNVMIYCIHVRHPGADARLVDCGYVFIVRRNTPAEEVRLSVSM